MPTRTPSIQAALAVVERGGRVLLARRRHGAHLAGCWEFPGGKRRVGETWRACVLREAREELGVAVQVVGRLEPLRFRYPDGRVCLQPFRCRIVSGSPKPLGSGQLRWVPIRGLARVRMPPANRPLVEKLMGLDGRAILKNTQEDRR